MFCQACGNANDTTAKFCAGCGNVLPHAAQDAFTPHAGVKGMDQNHKTALYKAIIGHNNQHHYMEKFFRFDEDGKVSASWNLPACFLTFYWLMYRKMWLNAFIYYAIPLFIISLIAQISHESNSPSSLFWTVSGLFLVAHFILPSMYGNAIYYKWCKKKISEVEFATDDPQKQIELASKKGGTSIAVFVSIAAIGVIGMLAAVSLPAYQDYTKRAAVAEVATFGSKATQSLSTYYDQHQNITSNLVDAGFSEALPASVKSVVVDEKDGVLTLTLLEGKTLLFVPSLDEHKKLSWQCMSKEIEDSLLPTLCRQPK